MGPRSDDRGNETLALTTMHRQSAFKWGLDQMIEEILLALAWGFNRWTLQWGLDQMIEEMSMEWSHTRHASTFNGASIR